MGAVTYEGKRWGALWVKLPRHWISALRRSRSVSTYHLAHTLLLEACERKTKTLTLSRTTVPFQLEQSRRRAARELAELGLIRIEQQKAGHALKVTLL
jgi:hypothetical protein